MQYILKDASKEEMMGANKSAGPVVRVKKRQPADNHQLEEANGVCAC